jgi:Alginate lyase
MPPIRLAAMALLGLALAACATATGQQTLFDPAGVPHPDALFDVASRSAKLRSVDGATGGRRGDRICVRDTDVPDVEALAGPSLAAIKSGGDSNLAARDFARALNLSAYHMLLSNDPATAQRDIALLRRHAEANAWLVPNPSWTNASGVIEGMISLMPAWQMLRQTNVATPEDRAVIEAWFVRLARQADEHPGDNNTGSARGAAEMLLGLIRGDDALYQRGMQTGYLAQLGQMRPDGSFPLETDRGRAALQLQSRNIALLLYSAEIAHSQGQNLYGAEVNGRTIDDAIRFLLAADRDNALVDVYARANRNPSRSFPVFAPMDQAEFVDSTARAWAFLYTTRFPRSELSDALRARIPIGRRVSSDTVGGNVTCYARPL